MEIIPRRLERVLPTGDGASAAFSWTVSAETVLQEIPDARVWRPEFEAGDALLFDHLCLHRTGAYPEMTRLRYAIESWWFASSVYPEGSTPLVI